MNNSFREFAAPKPLFFFFRIKKHRSVNRAVISVSLAVERYQGSALTQCKDKKWRQ